jgi:hypothetical protein
MNPARLALSVLSALCLTLGGLGECLAQTPDPSAETTGRTPVGALQLSDEARVHVVSIYEPVASRVPVEVRSSEGPVVLVLCSHRDTVWEITVSDDVELEAVLLGGYEGQRVYGVPPGVPVAEEVECLGGPSYGGLESGPPPSPPAWATKRERELDQERYLDWKTEWEEQRTQLDQTLQDTLGRSVSSVQACYSGSRFVIQQAAPLEGEDLVVRGLGVYEATNDGTIDVTVHTSDRALVLVLSSYEHVTWRLHLDADVELVGVVVGGPHGGDIVGLPEQASLWERGLWASTPDRGWDALSSLVEELVGQAPDGMQGAEVAASFEVR